MVKHLRMISKRYSSSLKTAVASKFYQEKNHKILSNVSESNISKFSLVMYSKDKNLHIINSKMIENLNWQYNPYTQIENACSNLSENYADGTFYLYNHYPVLSGMQNFNQKNINKKLIAKNLLQSGHTLGKMVFSNRKIFKESKLMMQFFS